MPSTCQIGAHFGPALHSSAEFSKSKIWPYPSPHLAVIEAPKLRQKPEFERLRAALRHSNLR